MSDTSAVPAPTQPAGKFLSCGDAALCVEFGDRADRHVSALVLALAHRIEAAQVKGIVELVPTFRSLLIHYDPAVLLQADLKATLAPLLSNLKPAQSDSRLWHLPACYDPSLSPDLADVAARTGLTLEQVVERHSAITYHVYMVGFLPGYPYMGDLAPELVLPRRDNPRTSVPAGSIAIATTQTAVYALESPGGWHLIGRTPAPLWDVRREPPVLLGPGDKVAFQPISLREYEQLLAKATEGTLQLQPEVWSDPGTAT